MNRRGLVKAALAMPVGFAATRAFAADRRIGWISPESASATAPFLNALKAGLTAAVPAGAEPVRIIERYDAAAPDTVARYIGEFQELGARLIVAQGAATVSVLRAKPTVPVVFGFSGDPVVAGIAQSLARPGGTATGMTFMSIELNPKRIDLIRTALPGCRKIAVLSNARHPGEENEIVACQRAVEPAGIDLTVHRVQAAPELRPALAGALDAGAEAAILLPSAFMVQQSPVLAADCIARKVPLVSGWATIARAGALMTYGPNLPAAYRRIAYYVVRILDGASPSSLPIEQPSAFELVVNARTASALGLTLSPTLLAQADEIIE